jgi:hypothetical protein
MNAGEIELTGSPGSRPRVRPTNGTVCEGFSARQGGESKDEGFEYYSLFTSAVQLRTSVRGEGVGSATSALTRKRCPS